MSSDTSAYWSFRHLWACGCLINSLFVWFDCLHPSSFSFFFKENYRAGSENGIKSHHSFTTTSSPFCITNLTLFLPILSSPYRSISDLRCLRGNAHMQAKQRTKGGENVVLGFCMGSGLVHLPSNSVWVYFSNWGEGLRSLVFLKEGNEKSPDWKSEETLKMVRKAVTRKWLSCLGTSYRLKFHFIFITHRTRITVPGRAASCVPSGLPEHSKQYHVAPGEPPGTDWQCFNYLGCKRRQNKSLWSSQRALKVLSKLCY